MEILNLLREMVESLESEVDDGVRRRASINGR